MLVLLELREYRKEYVQAFDQGLIVLQFMYRDIQHREDNTRVVASAHIDVLGGELEVSEGTLHLRRELLHELVKVGHLLGVIHGRSRPSLVQILDTRNPLGYFLGLLISCIDGGDFEGHVACRLNRLQILEGQLRFVFAVESRLVQLNHAQVFLGAVRLRHFEAAVHFSDGGDVVGDEGSHFSFQVYFLGLVSLNILEQVLHFTSDGQVGIITRVVGSRNFLIILTFFFFHHRSLGSDSSGSGRGLVLSGGLALALSDLRLNLSAGSLADSASDFVDFILFFIRLDIAIIIVDVDSQVIGLVVQLLSLHVFVLLDSLDLLGVFLARRVGGSIAEAVAFIEVEGLASLVGELVFLVFTLHWNI
uniref:NAD-specific glutamate dehydrogenase n=1 Tax=Strombidium inclinatum TaxID=197538 RepID=A0A7S3IKG6_9SPIT|mmetsp:Transcript_24659/g.38342  ORF Transcript_24659/g.38342 Transcript_24659/m.38342 type:complete len:362 (+) Transcript_24659:69-1154(+)